MNNYTRPCIFSSLFVLSYILYDKKNSNVYIKKEKHKYYFGIFIGSFIFFYLLLNNLNNTSNIVSENIIKDIKPPF
tara:strand:+ start:26 stop:253 length:228 start_codon:yes stop_codon:yes gene_type:complete